MWTFHTSLFLPSSPPYLVFSLYLCENVSSMSFLPFSETVTFEGHQILIQRRPNVKVISIRVYVDHSIRVSAPTDADTRSILAFLGKKWNWVSDQLTDFGSPNAGKDSINVDGLKVIVQRRNMKSVNLRLDSDLTPVVHAPHGFSDAMIADFVRQNMDFILSRRNSALPNVVSFKSGDKVYLFGSPKTLSVVIDPKKRSSFSLDADTLHATFTHDFPLSVKKRLFFEFLSAQLSPVIDSLLNKWLTKIGEGRVSWSIKNTRSRWGSCCRGTRVMSFSLHLAQLPMPSIESVVVHEICHLAVSNHGPNFYKLMDQRMPDWKLADDVIKEFCRRRYVIY